MIFLFGGLFITIVAAILFAKLLRVLFIPAVILFVICYFLGSQ